MKRVFAIVIAITVLAVCGTNVLFADETDIFANEEMSGLISQNLIELSDEEYNLFYGALVTYYDFEHLIPYYTITENSGAKEVNDVITFTGRYLLPVMSLGGNYFYGFAEIAETTDGKWEITSFSMSDYDEKIYELFVNRFATYGLNKYNKKYFVADGMLNNIVIVLEDNQKADYFDMTQYYNSLYSEISSISALSFIHSGDELLAAVLNGDYYHFGDDLAANNRVLEEAPEEGSSIIVSSPQECLTAVSVDEQI